MCISRALLLGVLACAAVMSGICRAEEGATIGREADFAPDRETRVADPACGFMGYYLVYVPADYTPDRAWPVVLFYHGLGGHPQADILAKASGGKGVIVVGMGYYADGMEGYQYLKTRDVEILRHVSCSLAGRLSTDPGRLFVAGFSKGGFYSSALLNEIPDMLAGALIFGAGARTEAAHPAALSGKRVFIGAGAEDPFGEDAVKAAMYYFSLGCKVTYERWPGAQHAIGERNTIGKWLEANVSGVRLPPVADARVEGQWKPAGRPTVTGVLSAVVAACITLWCLIGPRSSNERGSSRLLGIRSIACI
jgi:dienelactone hydrolase